MRILPPPLPLTAPEISLEIGELPHFSLPFFPFHPLHVLLLLTQQSNKIPLGAAPSCPQAEPKQSFAWNGAGHQFAVSPGVPGEDSQRAGSQRQARPRSRGCGAGTVPARASGPGGQGLGTLDEEESKKRRRCWNIVGGKWVFIILTWRFLCLRKKASS